MCLKGAVQHRTVPSSVCSLHRHPGEPEWLAYLNPWRTLRERDALAAIALDRQARACDDRAVLRCLVSLAWRTALAGRADSGRFWSAARELLVGARRSPNAVQWRELYVRVHASLARILKEIDAVSDEPAVAAVMSPVAGFDITWVPEHDLDPAVKATR